MAVTRGAAIATKPWLSAIEAAIYLGCSRRSWARHWLPLLTPHRPPCRSRCRPLYSRAEIDALLRAGA
jgi:hypothetical protein